MTEEAMPLFNFRMDAETKRKLEVMAKQSERDMSGYLRWLIRREWDMQIPTISTPTKTMPVNQAH